MDASSRSSKMRSGHSNRKVPDYVFSETSKTILDLVVVDAVLRLLDQDCLHKLQDLWDVVP